MHKDDKIKLENKIKEEFKTLNSNPDLDIIITFYPIIIDYTLTGSFEETFSIVILDKKAHFEVGSIFCKEDYNLKDLLLGFNKYT